MFFLSTDLATEIKPDVGKEKTAKYQSPEYFGYNDMSFYDIEKSCEKQRVPQPKSGLSEYWWYVFLFSLIKTNKRMVSYIDNESWQFLNLQASSKLTKGHEIKYGD